MKQRCTPDTLFVAKICEAAKLPLSRSWDIGEAGSQPEDWNAHDFIGAPTSVHPISSARKSEKFPLTVLVGYGSGMAATGAACQFDWSFTIAGDLITELIIAPARMPALGSAVAAFVNATNACDLDGVVATFAEDALVNDQLHEHWGRAAIREWAASEMIADKVTILVVGVVDHHGHSIVTANINAGANNRAPCEDLSHL